MKISNKSVIDALDGLPKKKHHCSNLGADALHRAIEDYKAKNQGVRYQKPADGADVCDCPVCDVNDPEEAPYCFSRVRTHLQVVLLSNRVLKTKSDQFEREDRWEATL